MKESTTKETPKENNLLKNSIHGLQFGILQQLISRILTFILNVFIVRKVSAEIIGIANVQFQLIVSTISLLTRESFRRAALRNKYDKNNLTELRKTITVSYWEVPVGLIGCYVVGKFFEATISNEEILVGDFNKSMWITVIATMFEILAEPMFILGQNLMLSKIRFFLESSSVLIKCIMTYILVTFFNFGLLSFAYSQLFSTFFVFVGYYFFFFREILSGRSLSFGISSFSHLFPDFRFLFEIVNKLQILFVIWLQSVLKLVLGEGEKYILKFKESLLDQGIYSIISNLASLVPRIIFAPIEEIAHTYFAKLVDNSSKTINPHFNKDKIVSAINIYNSLVKLMIMFGLYLATFGPPFSFFLLDFLYTSKVSLTDAPTILAFYCFYILTIAVNGVTEAFVHAVGTPSELNFFNLMLFFFSSVYIISSFIFISYFKTIGLIVSNCINMALRVIFSLRFTHRFFERNFQILQQKNSWEWKQILPKRIICTTFLIIFFVSKFTEQKMCSQSLIGTRGVLNLPCISHVSIGAVGLLSTVYLIYKFERDWINNLRMIWKTKND